MSRSERIADLDRLIKEMSAKIARYERVESELRSHSPDEDPGRLKALMVTNAEALNCARCDLGFLRIELVELTFDRS